MSKTLEKAAIKTLVYSDIFDYPLTLDELWKYLISSKSIQREKVEEVVKSSKKIEKKDGFYFLKGKKELVVTRRKKEKESTKKLKSASYVFSFLTYIPSVLLIGISGSMAMNNAKKEDDIDLFVICKANTIWTTRLLILIVLELMGRRRKRNEVNPKDKMCLNMVITEDNLVLNKKNIYTAHEVAQLRLLFERDNMYKRFVGANRWVLRYLPNTQYRSTQKKSVIANEVKQPQISEIALSPASPDPRNDEEFGSALISSAIEMIAKKIQLWYMKNVTNETISDSLLAFHPHNNEEWILKKFRKGLKQYEI